MGGTLHQINKSAVITRFSVRVLFTVYLQPARETDRSSLSTVVQLCNVKIYLCFLKGPQTPKKQNQKTKGLIKKKIYFSVVSGRESDKRHSVRSPKGICLVAFKSDWESWGTGERQSHTDMPASGRNRSGDLWGWLPGAWGRHSERHLFERIFYFNMLSYLILI